MTDKTTCETCGAMRDPDTGFCPHSDAECDRRAGLRDTTTNAAMRDPDAFAEGVVAERARIERIIEAHPCYCATVNESCTRCDLLAAIRGGDDA